MIYFQGMEFMFTSVTNNINSEFSLTEQDIEEFMRYMEIEDFWLNMHCNLSAK